MSGLSLLKRTKCWLVKIPGLDDLPHQQTMTMSSSCCDSRKLSTVQEVADEVGIGIGSCHQMFIGKLQMCHVSAKFVPRLFNDDQKENRVEISQELLANPNGTFLRTS